MVMVKEKLIRRAARSLDWLVTDCRLRFDDCRGNLEEGSKGGYSPELTEAINVLAKLNMFLSPPVEEGRTFYDYERQREQRDGPSTEELMSRTHAR